MRHRRSHSIVNNRPIEESRELTNDPCLKKTTSSLRSSVYQGRIFPGFMMFLGSILFLIHRIIATAASPCSLSRYFILPVPMPCWVLLFCLFFVSAPGEQKNYANHSSHGLLPLRCMSPQARWLGVSCVLPIVLRAQPRLYHW